MRKPEWLSKSIYKVRVGGRKKPSSCSTSAQSGRREPFRAAQCPGSDRTQQALYLLTQGGQVPPPVLCTPALAPDRQIASRTGL